MNTQGLLIVWGSLALCVVAIAVGYSFEPALWARALFVIGIMGSLAWICFVLWILNAMNTDI